MFVMIILTKTFLENRLLIYSCIDNISVVSSLLVLYDTTVMPYPHAIPLKF